MNAKAKTNEMFTAAFGYQDFGMHAEYSELPELCLRKFTANLRPYMKLKSNLLYLNRRREAGR